ncbi:tyrosine-type recombinase/integrase [Aquabacterium sp. A08]|uniref:tyrosine-type recombinase/integrase n=1 Tax=Aquabacterium sp. A08 TaxID=2718532 RepID=UPI00352FEFA3
MKPQRSWPEAVIRYLELKRTLKSFADVQRICRHLDRYLGALTLNQINGDVIWRIVQGELQKGNKPATVNRYLATIRNLLRMARDEWQWIDTFPKIRLLPGEMERDRWLTREEAERLVRCCPPHLAALVRFALATGCRAGEITGLEWNRVDLNRKTAWLNQTKNGTPRGVPLNEDAIEVLREQIGKHLRFCFTYLGQPLRADVTNTAWHNALNKAGIEDFRFHDLRHTWASWHRQAGTSCDELKDLGGWKTRSMVDRYAKFATENLLSAATRIERGRVGGNVIAMSRSCHG